MARHMHCYGLQALLLLVAIHAHKTPHNGNAYIGRLPLRFPDTFESGTFMLEIGTSSEGILIEEILRDKFEADKSIPKSEYPFILSFEPLLDKDEINCQV